MWGGDQSWAIYCLGFNFRRAGLFAQAPAAPSVPRALIDLGVGFFPCFFTLAALPAGCRCAAAAAAAAAAGSVACAVETGGLPGRARRWKRVKAPKGNSCAAAVLLPPRFLARYSRRARRASSIPPRRLSPHSPPGTPRPSRGCGGRKRLPRAGRCCPPHLFSPEPRRSGVFLLFPPAGIGFFSFPRQECVNKTLLLLLLLASMAAKSLLTLRGRPKRFPF